MKHTKLKYNKSYKAKVLLEMEIKRLAYAYMETNRSRSSNKGRLNKI